MIVCGVGVARPLFSSPTTALVPRGTAAERKSMNKITSRLLRNRSIYTKIISYMEKKKWIVAAVIFLFVFCISWNKSTDFSQDLGRHLKLGEIIVRTGRVPSTNLFSYTNPAFPFVNHHWLSEVIFYLLSTAFGLWSLYLLRFLLLAGAVYFFLRGRKNYPQYLTGAVVMLILYPFMVERIGIRPELFGYFLFSLLLYLIFFQENRRLLYLIPAIMLLWVNLHITFVFGLFLIVLGGVLSRKQKRPVWGYLLGILAVCFNPNGIYGAIEPFIIFRNYGYTIVENQTVFLINSLMINPILRFYLVLIPLIGIGVLTLFLKKQYTKGFIVTVFYLLGIWQVRHISFFVFAALPFLSQAYDYLIQDIKGTPLNDRLKKIPFTPLVILLASAAILVSVSGLYDLTYDTQKTFGYGFYESQKAGTDFILRHQLPGNVFNDFDIGGYAIYRLYPRYKVFVDNRPEAYPADFFQNVYIPLQENDELRRRVFKKYGVHTVLFAHTDITPWGRQFLANILTDASWKLLFANEDVIVMSDKTDLPDIRNNKALLQSTTDSVSDPVSLLHLANFMVALGQNDLADSIVERVGRLNPLSCSVKRAYYETQPAPDFYAGTAMSSKPWWCY